MLHSLLTAWLMLLSTHTMAAAIATGDYYIVHDFSSLLLSYDSGSPKKVKYDSANDANYIFTAESPSGNYVKLKHKATGLYLTASTSNGYSVLFSGAGSGDQYYWQLESVQRFSTRITSKKNAGKRLGCDLNGDGVYYDKNVGGLNWFSIIPSNGNGYEASRKATKTTTTFTNEYGVTERDVYCVTEDITVTNSGSNYTDLHIISSTPFDGGTVNLSNDKCWLVFENVRPSGVKSELANVRIAGLPAVAGTNCRIEIYLHGAVVIPTPSVDPFVATTSSGTFSLKNGSNGDLKENNNKAISFTLKRGSMATVASGKNGGGYSQVWVADHKDLTVTLPQALKNRVSSVWVRNWHYASKSGYGRTGNYMVECDKLGSSWYWNWDANLSSSEDIEYVPIKQHIYWPDNGNFWKSGSTAMMLYNEPDHSEQHSDDCGKTISEWTAYEHTGEFNSCGLRIGSPSATNLSWIKTYLDNCWNMAQRCDFTCTHGYWTSEWDNNLSTLDGYGRQVWITEWKYGASWTSGSGPSSVDQNAERVLAILDKLEYNDNVERYAYYPFDTGGSNGWMTTVFWDGNGSKGVNPTGTVYKNVKQHLGYKSSKQPALNWWAPDMNAPTIQGAYLQDGKYTLKVENKYTDNTKLLTIMAKNSSGNWTTVATADPSEYDNSTLYVGIDPAILGDVFTVKAVISSLHNSTTKESASKTFNMSTELASYRQLSELQNLSFNYGTFVKDGVATYAKDKTTGMNISGMQPVDGWTITENGDARAAAQYSWNSGYVLGGKGYPAATRNKENTTTGGGLGIVSVWTAQTQYTQKVLFPAGRYTLTIPIYNTKGTGSISENLFGFVESSGTKHYATNKTFAEGKWTTATIELEFAGPTTGSLSLGYTAADAGSGSMPHLFVDEVSITSDDRTWPLVGDANGDGTNSVADMATLINKLRGSVKSFLERCDADGNGTVNLSDVEAIVKKILQK